MNKPPQRTPSLPSKADLLAFIGKQRGKVGTREIARAFGLKNADRAALKQMLRELSDAGRIERRRKKLQHAGVLPSVVLADITQRDADGELVAATGTDMAFHSFIRDVETAPWEPVELGARVGPGEARTDCRVVAEIGRQGVRFD